MAASPDPLAVSLAIVAAAQEVERARAEAAEERRRLADQAAAHEEAIARQAAITEQISRDNARLRHVEGDLATARSELEAWRGQGSAAYDAALDACRKRIAEMLSRLAALAPLADRLDFVIAEVSSVERIDRILGEIRDALRNLIAGSTEPQETP